MGGDINHVFGGKNLDNTHIGTLWKPMCDMPHFEIKDWKFLLHYIMNFEVFDNLVLELTPFLQ
jgi:hypothetical protein